MGGRLTAFGASARLGTIAPAYALGALGYDARAVSIAGGIEPALAAARHAKRIVVGELFAWEGSRWVGPVAAYREILEKIDDRRARLVFSLADDHFDDADVGPFYREALPECLAVTVVSDNLAKTVRMLTDRPIHVMPEPIEGARGTPQAIAARRLAAPLAWLARRVGLSMDPWRVQLLWFGYPQNLPPLIELLPQLEALSARYPLALTCVTKHGVAEALAREDERLRIDIVAWSPAVVEAAIAACDLVLIPSRYRDPIKQAKSPNRLIAGLHGGRFVVAHPLPAYAPYAQFCWIGEDLVQGIEWALAHPREVVERIARGQALIDERHSPEAVARFWLEVFDRKK